MDSYGDKFMQPNDKSSDYYKKSKDSSNANPTRKSKNYNDMGSYDPHQDNRSL